MGRHTYTQKLKQLFTCTSMRLHNYDDIILVPFKGKQSYLFVVYLTIKSVSQHTLQMAANITSLQT